MRFTVSLLRGDNIMLRDYEYDVIEPLSGNFKYVASFVNSREDYKVPFDNLGKSLSKRGIDIMEKIDSFSTKEESLSWLKSELQL